MVLCGTESIWGGTTWYLMVPGQYTVFEIGTWWYWVSMGQYWLVILGQYNSLVLSGTGLIKGFYASIY